MNRHNLADINKANQPFEIIGKIKPMYADGIWTYTEEIYERPYMKKYPDDSWDCADYIDNPDKAIFFRVLWRGMYCPNCFTKRLEPVCFYR